MSSSVTSSAAAAFQLGFYAYDFNAWQIQNAISVLCSELPSNVHLGLVFACSNTTQDPRILVQNHADQAFAPQEPNFDYYQFGKSLAILTSEVEGSALLANALQEFWTAVDKIPINEGKSDDCISLLKRDNCEVEKLKQLMQDTVDLRRGPEEDDFDLSDEERLGRERSLELLKRFWKGPHRIFGHTLGSKFAQEIFADLAHLQSTKAPSTFSVNEERNKWIYECCVSGMQHKEIVAELRKRGQWYPITSVQGISKAAREYADRNGLPRPKPRRAGRPRKSKHD